MQFPNLSAWNNTRRVDMPLKLITQPTIPFALGRMWRKVNFFYRSTAGLNSERPIS